MGMTIDKCRSCKHSFTTGKDRLYCKKSLADKDDCSEYEMTIEEVNVRLYDIKTDAIYQITSEEKEAIDTAIDTMRKYQKIVSIVSLNDEEFKQCGLKELKEILEILQEDDRWE